MLKEFLRRRKFWKAADRLGPDIPLTHWKLYFPTAMRKICKQKFYHFATTAEVRPGSYIVGCSQISLGERVVIRPASHLHAASPDGGLNIIVEDDVLIGSGVHIYVGNHAFGDPDIPIIDQGHSAAKPVRIRKGAWIGANVILLPGVEIGENSVIAAGAVVTKSVPARVVAGGTPAKVLKEIIKYSHTPIAGK
ncbi:acyltransferase [Chitinophaga deserti]|uniref:acyltransferase n=1 Tax=Chitinophaga deserti TaxID=2164099 RepID=UPI000D6CFBCC|nr:acyltransferase [Chitinophaga deserti]